MAYSPGAYDDAVYGSEGGEEEDVMAEIRGRVSGSVSLGAGSLDAAIPLLGTGALDSRLFAALEGVAGGRYVGDGDDEEDDDSTIGHVMDALRRRTDNRQAEQRILDELNTAWPNPEAVDFAEAFHGDPRTGPSRDTLPLPTAARPPGYARVFYKVVARVGQRFLSVYDGVTEYAPGTSVMQDAEPEHGGGIYVYPSIQCCLKRDAAVFPPESRLLHAPRAIARVKAWNRDFVDEPVRYGIKRAYTYVHVLEILPYPETWNFQLWPGAGAEEVGARAGAGRRRVAAEPAGPSGVVGAEGAWRGHDVGREGRLLSLQVQTVGLEEDIAEMERRLQLARGEMDPREYLRFEGRRGVPFFA